MGTVGRVKVALYVRVSTDKQAEFGMSLDAQTAELERYCHERGWDVADTYVDAGFSGKDTERPAFKRMMQRIQKGGIDAIAVTKLDRLTRSVRNLCEINEDVLKGLGVQLICTRDGINTFELASSFLMHLLALIGQIERENTSKRVVAAIEHIHDHGGHYGKIPFGKMTAPHPSQPRMKILVDHPEESVWLKRIIEWYKAGKQPTEIASLLNENGVKPRYCARWNMQVVYSLLRVQGVHRARSADSPFVYDRHKAYTLALDLRQDGARLRTIVEALSKAQLRPKNAQRYTVSSVQDLLRSSILYNLNTAQGLALHLRANGHSLRDICDRLLASGFHAPRGGRWYPKTVADLMKKAEDGGGGVYSGSRRAG
jgi:DNA invertase Pin-like site-specific DNA recombinase